MESCRQMLKDERSSACLEGVRIIFTPDKRELVWSTKTKANYPCVAKRRRSTKTKASYPCVAKRRLPTKTKATKKPSPRESEQRTQ